MNFIVNGEEDISEEHLSFIDATMASAEEEVPDSNYTVSKDVEFLNLLAPIW